MITLFLWIDYSTPTKPLVQYHSSLILQQANSLIVQLLRAPKQSSCRHFIIFARRVVFRCWECSLRRRAVSYWMGGGGVAYKPGSYITYRCKQICQIYDRQICHKTMSEDMPETMSDWYVTQQHKVYVRVLCPTHQTSRYATERQCSNCRCWLFHVEVGGLIGNHTP